jgi:hypothetical protein
MMRITLLAALLLACNDEATPTHTLYRNSPLGPSDRIHVATFDSADKGTPRFDLVPFNQGNCEFVAKVLNENLERIAASKNGKPDARFWCEPGRFRS